MELQIIPILLIVLGPWAATILLRRLGWSQWLSPVILAYALGIVLGNWSGFPFDTALATTFSEVTVILAIPLLLFSTDIKGWFQHAPKTLISFGLCVLSGLISTTLVAFFFVAEGLDHSMISGMLAGVYTGGTPNMQAIGLAMGASEEVYIKLNAADIFCSGLYLIWLTSFAHRFLGWFLPDFEGDKGFAKNQKTDDPENWVWKEVVLALLLALLVLALSLGIVWAITGAIKAIGLLILLLTSASIGASFSPKVRALRGAFETGEYLLLMFCVAIGLLSDFGELLTGSTEIIQYTAWVFILTVALHLGLSALFRIDRDTTMITSTAAIYGPVFIGQIASVIGNRTLVFSGMATGLIGYAVGNFLGIGLAMLLQSLGL